MLEAQLRDVIDRSMPQVHSRIVEAIEARRAAGAAAAAG
jgi:hypothetical protein